MSILYTFLFLLLSLSIRQKAIGFSKRAMPWSVDWKGGPRALTTVSSFTVHQPQSFWFWPPVSEQRRFLIKALRNMKLIVLGGWWQLVLCVSLYRPKPIYCNYQLAHFSGFCRICRIEKPCPIIAVFVEYLRQFLIDLNQIYRHSSVSQNTPPWIFSAF